MRACRGGASGQSAESRGWSASDGFFVLRPVSELDPRFLDYCAASDSTFTARLVHGHAARSIATDSARLTSASSSAVPVHCRRAQRAIADFLDAETARIDALIAKKRRMIELLDGATSTSTVVHARRRVASRSRGSRGSLAAVAGSVLRSSTLVDGWRTGSVDGAFRAARSITSRGSRTSRAVRLRSSPGPDSRARVSERACAARRRFVGHGLVARRTALGSRPTVDGSRPQRPATSAARPDGGAADSSALLRSCSERMRQDHLGSVRQHAGPAVDYRRLGHLRIRDSRLPMQAAGIVGSDVWCRRGPIEPTRSMRICRPDRPPRRASAGADHGCGDGRARGPGGGGVKADEAAFEDVDLRLAGRPGRLRRGARSATAQGEPRTSIRVRGWTRRSCSRSSGRRRPRRGSELRQAPRRRPGRGAGEVRGAAGRGDRQAGHGRCAAPRGGGPRRRRSGWRSSSPRTA